MNEQTNWDQHIVGGPNDMFPQDNRVPGYTYGLDANQLGTWKDYHHNLLSETHSDTTAAAPVRGDIISAQGATPLWTRLARSVPGGAGLLNVLGFKQGDTEPTWYADEHNVLSVRHSDSLAASPVLGDLVHGNATPAWARLAGQITATKKFLTQTGSGAVSAVPAWDTIAVADVPAHNLLSTTHGDTLADTVVRGDIVYGNSTPKWARLAKPSAGAILTNDATDTAWDTMAWTSVAYNAGDFTASAGTWTVASGDVSTFAYRMIGSKTMVVAFVLLFTSVSAAPVTLRILIPNGKTVAKQVIVPIGAVSVGVAVASPQLQATGTTIFLYTTPLAPLGGAGAWAIATDTTSVWGEVTFEVT